MVEVIERDLNDRIDLFADAYADIYKHYDNAVKKLLDDKEELNKKIQDAFQERKEIIRGSHITGIYELSILKLFFRNARDTSSICKTGSKQENS